MLLITALVKTAACIVNIDFHFPSLIFSSRFIPSGVQSSACKEANQVSSKLGAKVIVMGTLGHEINAEVIPFQPQLYPLAETIVEAQSVRTVDNVEVHKEF